MMSLNSERDIYQDVVEPGMDRNDSLLMDEKIVQDQMIQGKLKIGEDSDDDLELVGGSTKSEQEEAPVYFEEAFETCEEVTVDYSESSMSVPLSSPMSPGSLHAHPEIKRERANANDEERLSLHLDYGDDKVYYEEVREVRDINDEDEETIATFVTAAGQQLALYAVEDSEDVFAVAVYDESGEPPTNFQFLMKSDVEKLIGEGAVRTVKKPSQIKKQLLTTQPPVFPSKPQRSRRAQNHDAVVSKAISRQQKVRQHAWNRDSLTNESCQAILEPNEPLKEKYSSKQSNGITYLMMNDAAMSVVGQSGSSQESIGSENEIVEQSTVQYILLGSDQSDSELTFDEIQSTLQALKFSSNKSMKKKTFNSKTIVNQQNAIENVDTDSVVPVKSDVEVVAHVIKNSGNVSNGGIPLEKPRTERKITKNLIHIEEECKNMPTQSEICNLIERRSVGNENAIEKSSEVVRSPSIDPRIKPNGIDSKQHSINILKPCVSDVCAEIRPKIKRSRKQQLTLVNRGDSEIIIQPALIGGEEEINSKKRGRRKKKPATDPDYNPRPVRSKKSKKMSKDSKVEIIEIDIDEQDQNVSQTRKDVIEIIIEEVKEKGSSDKENEIIMVGDSDDESQTAPSKPIPPAMQCVHCSRNFRQKRALDTHSRVCPKLRNNIDKAGLRRLEESSGTSDKESLDDKQVDNKQFTCKVCNEKFDAVVALARHARTEHQKKYRNKSNKSSMGVKTADTKIEIPKEHSVGKRVTRISQKKKSQSLNQTWRSKKLNCDDCGRWFPSTAILAAHCLQHATKNSEKQIRQCPTCKKLMKTRSLYIKHMKTHSTSTRKTKVSPTVLQKKLRQTRQVTSKITTAKKRGRPRKL